MEQIQNTAKQISVWVLPYAFAIGVIVGYIVAKHLG